MARKREIGRGFYTDEDLAERSVWARLLFPGLWQLADREGRLEDRPVWIRVQVFPYDDLEAINVSMNALLDELARPKRHSPRAPEPFIVRYEVAGRRYIQIVNFHRHQHPHPNELKSQIPPPPKVTGNSQSTHRVVGEQNGSDRAEPSGPSEPSEPSGNGSGRSAPVAPTAGEMQSTLVPVAIRTQPAKKGPPTWLTRPGDLWRARWGDDSEPPWGEMASSFERPRKAFEGRGELELLWEGWERFLAASETSQFARPKRFVEGLGEWIGRPGPQARASPRGGPKSVDDRAMDGARQAIEAHRARGGK